MHAINQLLNAGLQVAAINVHIMTLHRMMIRPSPPRVALDRHIKIS
jgi:hypothetical protein